MNKNYTADQHLCFCYDSGLKFQTLSHGYIVTNFSLTSVQPQTLKTAFFMTILMYIHDDINAFNSEKMSKDETFSHLPHFL